mmetsp:Transcript_4377/g.6367  ORF Transcript_4377/g.6367 Transcript_4377/m.6367 type:complete len:98 (-) Transcript_4377:655-948(-)
MTPQLLSPLQNPLKRAKATSTSLFAVKDKRFVQLQLNFCNNNDGNDSRLSSGDMVPPLPLVPRLQLKIIRIRSQSTIRVFTFDSIALCLLLIELLQF